MEILWLILILVLLAIEIASLGLLTIWFMLGALAAFFVALAGGQIWLQVIVFIIVSILTLIGLRPIATKYINAKTEKTNVETMVGKTVRVVERVDNIAGTGRVVIGGMEWMARSVDVNVMLEVDQLGVVERVEGVKLILKKQD
ncbi:MAG: NfeD family protein [Lachnospiraceae bacterium]|nr:NfeD family protein [Lachnospiraceae bacterium]